MRSTFALGLLLATAVPATVPRFWSALAVRTSAAPSPRQSGTLLAVFAHPDDETSVAPVLAHYARQGATVYLAIATKGEKGDGRPSSIAAGEPLALVRRDEATCACRELGISPPIFVGLNDGELGAITGPPGKNVQSLVEKIRDLIGELHPDVLVTWGPDGGDGHPDHRLVSDAVTEVVQAHSSSPKLFYVGVSEPEAKLLNSFSRIQWRSVDPAYLTVSVAFDATDTAAWHRALECHRSQFPTAVAAKLEGALDEGWNGTELFRPWFGNRRSTDLFD